MKTPSTGVAPYKPLRPSSLYLTQNDWKERVAAASVARLSPFAVPESPDRLTIDCEGKAGRSFAAERADETASVFDAAVAHVKELQGSGHHVILASWSDGSRDRLCGVLTDHGLKKPVSINTLTAVNALKRGTDMAVAVWGLDSGFVVDKLAVISEGDILGDRLVRQKRKSKRPQDIILEVQALQPGDLVVHADHGIGRFVGLKTVTAAGGAARLPGDPVCRRTAAAAGGEYRASDPLRLGRCGGCPRSSRRRCLAGPQGQDEEAHPGDGRPAHQDRGRALRAPGAPPPGSGRPSTASSPPASHSRRPRTRPPPSTPSCPISMPVVPWTASSAAMSASARPRWRCAPPSRGPWAASRWRWWCPPPCWRASITGPSPSASKGCRCRWRSSRASSPPPR